MAQLFSRHRAPVTYKRRLLFKNESFFQPSAVNANREQGASTLQRKQTVLMQLISFVINNK